MRAQHCHHQCVLIYDNARSRDWLRLQATSSQQTSNTEAEKYIDKIAI